jgi:hypothetical protein
MFLAIAHAVKIALLAALVGIVVRRRADLCWAFPAYVVVILVSNCLQSFWPERFYNPEFWLAKQRAYDVLKLVLALELAWRAFRLFPGALRTARIVLAAIIGATTLTVVFVTPPADYSTFWAWQPSIVTGTLWLFTATALLVVWYQIPVHDWQRAIMMGLVSYLVVFVLYMDLFRRLGWEHRELVGLLDVVAYLALCIFWAWAAWRRDPPMALERQKAAA